MQFTLTPELEAFRGEILAFIAEHAPERDPGMSDMDAYDAAADFQHALAERGWLTAAWPEKFGGLGASYWQQLVFNYEMAYHRLPAGDSGVSWVGPAILLYGSEEQKAEHITKISKAESHWSTLYSEPGAGSDLASLSTRAVRDGDDYVINGQKIWTSGAHRADWGWMAARTDPDAPKHKGISALMVDMQSPGITIRPLVNMAGGHMFNEVFFEDVRVPVRNRVGEENKSWYYIAVALDFERSGIFWYAGGRRTLEDMIHVAREHQAFLQRNPNLRYELADRMVEVNVGTYLSYRITSMQTAGVVANYEASVSKLFGSELMQRLAHSGIRLLGTHGMVERGNGTHLPVDGSYANGYVGAVMATIAGGTGEIQRNVIATRGLGLPRE